MGIEIPNTTDTAVVTTIAVRSLRLISTLNPLVFDGWDCAASKPRARLGRDKTRRTDTTARSAASGPALGSNHPTGGARTCTITT